MIVRSLLLQQQRRYDDVVAARWMADCPLSGLLPSVTSAHPARPASHAWPALPEPPCLAGPAGAALPEPRWLAGPAGAPCLAGRLRAAEVLAGVVDQHGV